ncbi:hypothetical protein POM88_022667 [Heracleum sosnowskyi]|uniref:TF-B3 domain-containing protein n=1 Tax=Heracleum sosnowskyi TaxID=360622 RepID=A0AAD8MU38_9APIA|nr:hypothetical protein POM88_022667 [Heracleum sosnowskyi]
MKSLGAPLSAAGRRAIAPQDSSGLVCERFVRFLTRSDTWRNEMGIPSDFCSKYGNRLSGSLHVIVRNGYRLPVEFDCSKGNLKGFLKFFKHFNLKGGEMLLFEYYGRYDLNVYIIGNFWFLQLRKFGRRWKIGGGWVRFSQVLRLSVGDVLVFDMNAPPLGFSLCVYRIAERY